LKPAIAVALAALSLAACTQVKPGHVGIRVNQYGSGAGVDPHAHGVGTYWNTFGVSYEIFPTSTQNYTWAASAHEGQSYDEGFHFQDKSGVDMDADVGIAYHVDPALAPVLYQKWRMETPELVSGPIRNAVRNAIVVNASGLPVEEIYGPRKNDLIKAAQDQVQKQFAPYGLVVEQLYWASGIRVPQAISQQITARVANENAALAAQANVATARANAEAQVAEAKGKADAMALEAAALRQNPELAQLRAVEKWDGRLPQYAGGGALPFIGVK
jgi:regulator of protease activity HflC (stomatin/prohibitin superfamily)